jgi:AcrR family transcriptional regulator
MLDYSQKLYNCPFLDTKKKIVQSGAVLMNKKEKTNSLIQKNLLSLLETKKLAKITIDNICEKSNIRRSTFYNHYHDKYHVLEEINSDICCTINNYLKIRFSIKKIDTILCEIIESLDKETFLTMIKIQEENVNLGRDLREVIKKRFNDYITENKILTKIDVSESFLEELFASIALTFVETSIREGNTLANAKLINNLYEVVLTYYNIDMEAK